MNKINDLFKRIMQKDSASLYPYQHTVANALLEGKNVVLQAPTGAGKTWAAVLPFVWSWLQGQPFADRVIYALPLRSLANNLYDSTLKSCKALASKELNKPLNITIQTGARREDPFFQGDIIFTTIDQLLSGYLNLPLSLPPKLSNINSGSLMGSLIILDEIHLLDPSKSLATVLEMSARLMPFTQFMFMTATMSDKAMEIISKHLKGVIIKLSEEELLNLPSHSSKQRSYQWVNEPISAEKVAKSHAGGRSIVVCNTVSRAQDIYRELYNLKKLAVINKNTELFLLHSHFYQEDRKMSEDKLLRYFGPEAKLEDAILVSTQVIEAGVDISADNFHTEISPANSLIQRAGRCARYPAPRNVGTIYIYDLEINSKGQLRKGPYKEWLSLDRTRELLKDKCLDNVTYLEEKNIIEKVHEENELHLLNEIKRNLNRYHQTVDMAINSGERSYVRDLIRDVDSISLIVYDKPNEIDFSKGPKFISIPRSSLFRLKEMFNELLSKGENTLVWMPVSVANDDFEDEEDTSKVNWHQITSFEQMMSAWLLVLSPLIARYDAQIGLQLAVPGERGVLKYGGKTVLPTYSYKCESYYDHIKKVLKALRAEHSDNRIAESKLAKALNLSKEIVNQALEIATALHDTGKLTYQYQSGSKNWQRDYYPSEDAYKLGLPLAHTTYNPTTDFDKKKNPLYKRGNHSLEGAYAVSDGLCDFFENLDCCEEIVRAMVTAISRHHSGRAVQLESFSLKANATEIINESLTTVGISKIFSELCEGKSSDIKDFSTCFVRANEDNVLPLYWYIVRRLRLADQASLKEKKGGRHA